MQIGMEATQSFWIIQIVLKTDNLIQHTRQYGEVIMGYRLM